MPLYEYACCACGEQFEQRLRFDERLTPQTCPRCASTQTVLCMSAPAVMAGSTSQAVPTCPSTGGPCGCGRREA